MNRKCTERKCNCRAKLYTKGLANEYLAEVSFRLLTVCLVLARVVHAEKAMYANSSNDLVPGARLPGMGNVSLGMPADPSMLLSNPAGLAELDRPEGFFHHANLYQGLDISQDEIFGSLPLGNGTVVGFGGQRVSVSNIPRVDSGETPNSTFPRTFEAADWTLAAGISRSLLNGHLLVGGLMRLGVRDLDQYGLGAQLDGSVVWKPVDGLRVGARLERIVATATVWESGRKEWSPMDLATGIGYELPVPYLYGSASFAFETPGLFQTQASNSFSNSKARLWDDPNLFLRSCRIGSEFRFDWGGFLRVGAEIQALTRWSDFFQGRDEDGLLGESRGLAGFGVGYLLGDRLKIDYALQGHPDLGLSHRISLGWRFGSPAAKPTPTDAAPTVPPAAIRQDAPPSSDTSKVETTPDEAPETAPPALPIAPPPQAAPPAERAIVPADDDPPPEKMVP